VKTHPSGMPDGTERSPRSWSRLVKTMRLDKVEGA
jgi:hypothetical protein